MINNKNTKQFILKDKTCSSHLQNKQSKSNIISNNNYSLNKTKKVIAQRKLFKKTIDSAQIILEKKYPNHNVFFEKTELPYNMATVCVFKVKAPNNQKQQKEADILFVVNDKILNKKEVKNELRNIYGWNSVDAKSFINNTIDLNKAKEMAKHYAREEFNSDKLGEVIIGKNLKGEKIVYLFPILIKPNLPKQIIKIRESCRKLKKEQNIKVEKLSLKSKTNIKSKNLYLSRQKLLQQGEGMGTYGTIAVAYKKNRSPFWHSAFAAPAFIRNYDKAYEIAKNKLGNKIEFSDYYHISPLEQLIKFSNATDYIVVNIIKFNQYSSDEWKDLSKNYEEKPLIPFKTLKNRWEIFSN